MLLGQSHDDLRLKRAALEPFHDLILNFRGETAFRPDAAGVWDRDVALLIDCLGRNINEVTCANTGLGGKKAARRRLEDGHANNVADSETKRLRRASIGECRGQSRRMVAENASHLRRHLYQGIGKAGWVGDRLPLDVRGLGTARRHDSATGTGECQQANCNLSPILQGRHETPESTATWLVLKLAVLCDSLQRIVHVTRMRMSLVATSQQNYLR